MLYRLKSPPGLAQADHVGYAGRCPPFSLALAWRLLGLADQMRARMGNLHAAKTGTTCMGNVHAAACAISDGQGQGATGMCARAGEQRLPHL